MNKLPFDAHDQGPVEARMNRLAGLSAGDLRFLAAKWVWEFLAIVLAVLAATLLYIMMGVAAWMVWADRGWQKSWCFCPDGQTGESYSGAIETSTAMKGPPHEHRHAGISGHHRHRLRRPR